MAQWTILVLSLCGVLHGQGIRPPTVPECCQDGRTRASRGQDCSVLPLISSSQTCRISQEQCCAAAAEDDLCDSGVAVGLATGECEQAFVRSEPCRSLVSKRCCDCCLLGLMEAKRGSSCEFQGLTLGGLCADTAKTCCSRNTADEATAVTEPPQASAAAHPPMEPDSCRASNCSQLCVGRGTCACRDGHRLREDGVTCEDVNECLTGSHDCVLGQVCINTPGSFRCQREVGCGTGYELWDDNSCQDIDECSTGLHNCGPDFTCTNTEGSFRCLPKQTCSAGFTQDAVGTCIDINECVVLPSPCPPVHACVNTAGSYACRRNVVTCGRGYRLTEDATRCEDVDECRERNTCGDHGCVNLVGSHRCECRTGFIFNSITKLCEDINECRYYPGRLCAHRCENTEGSYRCSCTTGFKLSSDGRNCEDVNECDDQPCSQECANVYGSFQCYCRRGYQLSDADGITCEDIDECALPAGGHVCSHRCANSPGSFHCTCPPSGYMLAPNGRTCQDVDECAAGVHTCSASETCFNVHGGFRCLSFKCPPNFRQAAHGRCERMACKFTQDPASCLSLPLRVSFYNITFTTNTPVPADVFRMGPSNSVPGDDMVFSLVSGDEEGYFTVQQQAHGGVVSLQRALSVARDFLLTVEMRLIRYGTEHVYVAKVAVFITHEQPIVSG
ncbi:fibulin-1-like isoform X2 [Betta splendens]|uniref:Fibulin-1 n=1 Tax=Betta splendens TaxID=158456 RepID=A0A6P7NHT6_BETSP|nr:fibulin-1-like isoform X2 [Betta splendens]